MEEKKKNVINLNELTQTDRDWEPRFTEEFKRDENGEIKAYVMKRNPNFKK
jgi:hypothetical protein